MINMPQRQADVVQALDQPPPGVVVDLEVATELFGSDLPLDEVDGDRRSGMLLDEIPQLFDDLLIGNFRELSEHLSVYQTSPELWEREAFEEQLDGAPEATGEPGKSSAGDFGRLAVRAFFSAGAGLLAWSDMPVETAQ